ncbi:TPA: hypothetical protein DIV55_03655 [Patescibacteria group bacterium]|uniref:Competence protein ComEC n=1 Tax=Candidatus Gottesmanbacteria bacterium GW2011_GWA1_43_11 TaxID=1618436 RepID=A0A0G1FGN8_9BACT|nr:MAG: Competence protein ComEC [Candidatus Gottesmanbacteria bacterium GW2011_GWA1_43_11]HCS78816.1 hypothetical protein [Patescibacteria group bacterium]
MTRKSFITYCLFVVFCLVVLIIFQFPDGKLHIYYCDVGQGDGIYIRLPNQADVLIDGGPDGKILACLGKYMPFYDRTIDLVLLTHPQKDHLQGLIDVLKRYTVLHFSSTPIRHSIEGYHELAETIHAKKIPVSYLKVGDVIDFKDATFSVLWPEIKWLEELFPVSELSEQYSIKDRLEGLRTDEDLNFFSLYLNLRYGNFDALFTGDGDSQVQELFEKYNVTKNLPENVDVLKVPHHGSKTGVTQNFLNQLTPRLSIISVGKNSYGHPADIVLTQLQKYGEVLTTQKQSTIQVVTDGKQVDVFY